MNRYPILLIILLSVILLVLTLLGAQFPEDLFILSNKNVGNLFLWVVAFLILVLIFFYLHFEDSKSSRKDLDEIRQPKGNAEKDMIRRLIIDMDSLSSEFKKLSDKTTFSEDEKMDIKNSIISNCSSEFIGDTFKSETDKLESKLLDTLGLKSLKDSFFITINRLNIEIRKLYTRANINLLLGVAITMGGLYFLYETIDSINISAVTSIPDIIISNLPRFTLVVFIELFSYFFLRLYKLGLDEIKYFQNELTNIELKLIAVEVAFITKNEESMKEALKVLVETERNFILKKGETTVALEKAKSESESVRDIMKAIPTFLKKNN